MRVLTFVVVCSVCAGSSVSFAAASQVELDRIVSQVNNKIVTQSDVQQARTLALVADVSSDDAVRRALEDRILILGEIARSAPLTVTDADVASRRAAWETRAGGHDRALALLQTSGTSDTSLQTWMRDDARIDAFLTRQFGGMPEAERPRATADWLTRLRQRAGLK